MKIELSHRLIKYELTAGELALQVISLKQGCRGELPVLSRAGLVSQPRWRVEDFQTVLE